MYFGEESELNNVWFVFWCVKKGCLFHTQQEKACSDLIFLVSKKAVYN